MRSLLLPSLWLLSLPPAHGLSSLRRHTSPPLPCKPALLRLRGGAQQPRGADAIGIGNIVGMSEEQPHPLEVQEPRFMNETVPLSQDAMLVYLKQQQEQPPVSSIVNEVEAAVAYRKAITATIWYGIEQLLFAPPHLTTHTPLTNLHLPSSRYLTYLPARTLPFTLRPPSPQPHPTFFSHLSRRSFAVTIAFGLGIVLPWKGGTSCVEFFTVQPACWTANLSAERERRGWFGTGCIGCEKGGFGGEGSGGEGSGRKGRGCKRTI